MKKLSTLCLCLLIPIILIPVIVGLSSEGNRNKSETEEYSTPDEASVGTLSDEETNYILCNAMMYIDDDTQKSAKEALVAISLNNYLFEEDNNISHKEIKLKNYSDDLLSELKDMLNENTVILFEGKRVLIPIENISAGYIATDDEYPYISPVASPWDVFNEEYNKEEIYSCGISATGINYLCGKGYSAKEALKWYLPEFTIEI